MKHQSKRMNSHGSFSRSLYILLIITLAVSLVSCQDSGQGVSETSGNAVVEPDITEPNSASQQLDLLIERFAESTKPEGGGNTLSDVSAEFYLAEIEANRQLLKEINLIDASQLNLEESIDQRMLKGLLESDIYTAEQRRVWENDASLYVPASQIGRLLEPLAAEPVEERASTLRSMFDALPQRFATARANLKNPPKRFTDSAIFKTRGTTESLKNDTAALAEQLSTSKEAFVQSVDIAIAALEEYESFLQEDLLPRSTGSWAIGKEQYAYILKHRWHMDDDADSILARGLEAFETTEALAQEVSERIEPGLHWSEVYEKLKDEHPPADGIKAAYQKSIDEAQAFVLENQIITLPAGERVITVDTPPAMRRSSPFGTFQGVDRFGTDLEGRLVLTPIEDWMSPEQQAQRLRSHHDAWVPIIAVHEAYPGHHADALITRENPRLLRKVIQEPIFSEGWGLFTEELMYEKGFLKGDDVRLTQLRNRLWRAARVILDSSLHTGQMTFDEAVEFLAERVRFEPYAAELEVGMYITYPTYVLGYLIGMQELMAIREEWVAKYGEPSPPSEFYNRLLGIGSLPPVLVRESLFGEDQ